jgi:hypothetical protein
MILFFQFKKKINKYSYKFVYQSILKKTTVHENEDNFVQSTHGILNTNRQSVFRNSILQQAIEKLQLNLSRSTIAIYPYEKPL